MYFNVAFNSNENNECPSYKDNFSQMKTLSVNCLVEGVIERP